MYKVEDYIDFYNEYFKVFNKLAVGEFADLNYGIDTPNGTSSSLESIIAYANYIKGDDDKEPFILNAGAGASSWMFRKLFRYVACYDPNKKYIELVKKVCEYCNLDNSDFYDRFDTLIQPDHVYYDYGDIERLPYLGIAIDKAIQSIYIDDTDCRDECRPYRQHVIDLCKAKGLKWFDCLEAKDESGRWGIIIEK